MVDILPRGKLKSKWVSTFSAVKQVKCLVFKPLFFESLFPVVLHEAPCDQQGAKCWVWPHNFEYLCLFVQAESLSQLTHLLGALLIHFLLPLRVRHDIILVSVYQDKVLLQLMPSDFFLAMRLRTFAVFTHFCGIFQQQHKRMVPCLVVFQ